MNVLVLFAVVLLLLTLNASALSSHDAHVSFSVYVAPMDEVWSDVFFFIIANSKNEVLKTFACWSPDTAHLSFTWPCGTPMKLLSFARNITATCAGTGPIVEVQGVLSGVTSQYVFKYGKAKEAHEARSARSPCGAQQTGSTVDFARMSWALRRCGTRE